MSNEVAVSEYLKKYASQEKTDSESMASASISVPRLSYKGKRFKFIADGEEELVKELTVKVIILGVEPDAGKFIKTYYATNYTSDSSDAPTCSSTNGIQPDSWVSAKQSEYCTNCKQNAFGSAVSMKGKPAKACKDGKRLWIAKPDNPTKFYGLNIPTMSLKNLSEYGKFIGKNNFPLSLVITELGFDEKAEYQMLTFTHVGFVEETNTEQIMQINAARPWRMTFSEVQIPYTEPTSTTSIAEDLAEPVAATTVDEDVIKWG